MTDFHQPADVDAERAVLSSVLLDPRVFPDLSLAPDDFYDPRNAEVWRVMQEAHKAGKPLDPLVLSSGMPPRARSYLAEIHGDAPAPRSAGHYAGLVSSASVLRALAVAGSGIVQRANRRGADASETAEECRSLVDKAAAGATSSSAVRFLGDALIETLDGYEKPVESLPSPWPDLDRMTGGFRRGGLYIIGARPGVGKSVLGHQLARHVASTGAAVLLSSLEMSESEVHGRILASAGTINLGRLNSHTLTDEDWTAVARVTSKLDIPLAVDDRSNVRVVDIRGRARDVARKVRLGMVVVDYLQLVTPPPKLPREQQVSEISRSLKLLARELDCPVVAMAQLNRSGAQRQDKRPTLTDLRESGSIEADADGVLLLHYDADEDPDGLDVILGKNRHGPLGTVSLLWQGQYARAVSLHREVA